MAKRADKDEKRDVRTCARFVGNYDENYGKSYEKRGFRHALYAVIKRLFDLISSLVLSIVLTPFVLIFILVKFLEDVCCPKYELSIERADTSVAPQKKTVRATAKDGTVYDCRLKAVPWQKGDKRFVSPVYVSDRVGKNGKVFRMLKIRSMVLDAENMKRQLLEAGLNEADEPAFKMKNDPRITPFGKFLRKTSADELLQLFNVLFGQLSVVGPRSPLISEVEQYSPSALHRLDVKGGLLCLWQISHDRNSICFDEWVDMDVSYIRRQSVWLDLKIIFKGAFMVLFDGSGE